MGTEYSGHGLFEPKPGVSPETITVAAREQSNFGWMCLSFSVCEGRVVYEYSGKRGDIHALTTFLKKFASVSWVNSEEDDALGEPRSWVCAAELTPPERPGAAFERLLREAADDPTLWVPGIGNGAMDGVVCALARLSDKEIVRVVRLAVVHAKKNE